MTIELARRMGLRVALLESSAGFSTAAISDQTFVDLTRGFPEVAIVRARDCDFRIEDFEDVHLNTWGAERLSMRLIEILKIKGDQSSFPARSSASVRQVALPPVAAWKLAPDATRAMDGDPMGIEWEPGSYAAGILAVSPQLAMVPGGHYVLEFDVTNPNGVSIDFGSPDQQDQLESYTATSMGLPRHFPPGREQARFYLRFTARDAIATVRLVDSRIPVGVPPQTKTLVHFSNLYLEP